jgi:hypothetical protein
MPVEPDDAISNKFPCKHKKKTPQKHSCSFIHRCGQLPTARSRRCCCRLHSARRRGLVARSAPPAPAPATPTPEPAAAPAPAAPAPRAVRGLVPERATHETLHGPPVREVHEAPARCVCMCVCVNKRVRKHRVFAQTPLRGDPRSPPPLTWMCPHRRQRARTAERRCSPPPLRRARGVNTHTHKRALNSHCVTAARGRHVRVHDFAQKRISYARANSVTIARQPAFDSTHPTHRT